METMKRMAALLIARTKTIHYTALWLLILTTACFCRCLRTCDRRLQATNGYTEPVLHRRRIEAKAKFGA